MSIFSCKSADSYVTYTVIRSNRRSLSLEITRDVRVLVRAPLRCSQAEVERFVLKHQDWLYNHLEKQHKRMEAYPEPAENERIDLISRAKADLPKRVVHYSSIMGLTPSGITITSAKTRFGSCGPKNRLCFSWRLMLYPDAAIDYVVVHELAHIVHKNHSGQFYAMIERFLPDYKDRRKLLKG